MSDKILTVEDVREANFKHLRRVFYSEYPGGSKKEFAEWLGITPQALGHIDSGRRKIGANIARQIEEARGLPFEHLDRVPPNDTGSEQHEKRIIAVLEELIEEMPPEFQKRAIEGVVTIYAEWLKKNKNKAG